MTTLVRPRPGPVTEAGPAQLAIPERLSYRIKRRLLGPPMVTAQLHQEKLSKKAALGVLSSDCISSAAYGSEEMLIVLLAVFGLSGFRILVPMTLVVLAVLVLMTLSYREVVMVYTRAGGSYVVARDNFGPKVAQIAAVALLIDYIVTVAVQSAAGVAALTSLVPALADGDLPLYLTVLIVLVLAYGNLRGVREAGRAFAFPTYFFVASAGLVVLIGIVRSALGELPRYGTAPGMLAVDNRHYSIFSALAVFYLLKAFANGGASLTGLEAISNGVSAFRPPEGANARRTLSVMSVLLGSLVLGISYLAYQTHATPYTSGSPTVISEVARAAFGGGWDGHLGFVLVQVATALILITGANTPFTGFPFLASFIAEDSFLPRQLTRRGHRLAFSNGIVVLTLLALALLLGVGAHVDKLIPFYAIGVFTGFTMAGFGMARYHSRVREPGWRHRLLINFSGGLVSLLVVLIFAVVKFTEGAWLVVLLFPLGCLALIRLNTRYRDEARALDLVTALGKSGSAGPPHYARHVVLVLIDRLDLAVVRALRYAGSLRPTEIRAEHLVLDAEVAKQLQRDWIDRGLGDRVPLELVACPDRRLVHAAARLALGTVVQDQAEVTVLLPRRTFHRFSQRILHDRTADRIAEAIARLPHVSATIVPFDTTLPPELERQLERQQRTAAAAPALISTDDLSEPAPEPARREPNGAVADGMASGGSVGSVVNGTAVNGTVANGTVANGTVANGTVANGTVAGDAVANGAVAIGSVSWRQQVTVQGRIKLVGVGTTAGKSLEAQVFDGTGGIRLLFFGRTQIPGIEPGRRVRASGRVGEYKGHLALANPRYELLAEGDSE